MNTKKTDTVYILTIVLIFLLVTFGIVRNARNSVEHEILEAALKQAQPVKDYMMIQKAAVTGIKNQVESNINAIEQGLLSTWDIEEKLSVEGLQYYLDAIPSRINLDQFFHIGINGKGDLKTMSTAVRNELIAATNAEASLRTAFEGNRDMAWAYYLSRNNFIYLASLHEQERIPFETSMYDQINWPEYGDNNTFRITHVYQDILGKGMMVTLGDTVFFHGRAQGIAGIDILTTSFIKYLASDHPYAHYYLVNEDGDPFYANEKYSELEFDVNTNLLDKNIVSARSGALNLKILPIVDQHMWMVSAVERSTFYLQVARKSAAGVLAALLVAALLIMVLLVLRSMLKNRHMARHDPLTGLLNRAGLKERVMPLFSQVKASHPTLSLFLIDIDYFKKINDSYGHFVGDKVLQALAKDMQEKFHIPNIVARLGGEEFVLVLPRADREEALRLAVYLCTSVEKKTYTPLKIQLTISIGCSVRRHNEGFSAMLKRADDALLKAKNAGRNRVSLSVEKPNLRVAG